MQPDALDPLFCTRCRRQTGRDYLKLGMCPACRYAMAQAPQTIPDPAPAYAHTPAQKRRVSCSPGDAQQAAQNAGCCGLAGCALCLTGIGAVLGIPLLVWSIIDQNRAAARVKDVWTGACPYCGFLLDLDCSHTRGTCPRCSGAIVVDAGEFWAT